jgi:hypothetical protein
LGVVRYLYQLGCQGVRSLDKEIYIRSSLCFDPIESVVVGGLLCACTNFEEHSMLPSAVRPANYVRSHRRLFLFIVFGLGVMLAVYVMIVVVVLHEERSGS